MTGFSHLLQRAADVLEDPWRIRPTLGTVAGKQPQRQQLDRHSAVDRAIAQLAQERGGPDPGPGGGPVDN